MSDLGNMILQIKKFWNKRSLMSKDEFLSWARENRINSNQDFRQRFGRAHLRPANVPADPARAYNMSWTEVPVRVRPLRPIREGHGDAQRGIFSLDQRNNVRSITDFKRIYNTEARPKNLPSHPESMA